MILEPDGDFETAADEDPVAGFSHAGPVVHLARSGCYVHESIADDVRRRARRPRRGARRRRPARRGDRRVGAHLGRRARPGRRRGSTRRPRPARRSPPAATVARRRAAPDRPHRRPARHEGVLARGVRARRRRRRATATSTTRSARQRHPLRAAGRDLHQRPAASRCGPRASSTSAACSSTRCRRSAPTRCPTAACATAATRKEGPHYAVRGDDRGTAGRHPGLTRTGDRRRRRHGALDGKVALITGGGSGIGRATASGSPPRARASAWSTSTTTQGRAVAERARRRVRPRRRRRRGRGRRRVRRVRRELGGVDIAFLNAGIAIGIADIDRRSPTTAYRRIMRVNVDGVVFGIRAAIRGDAASGAARSWRPRRSPG